METKENVVRVIMSETKAMEYSVVVDDADILEYIKENKIDLDDYDDYYELLKDVAYEKYSNGNFDSVEEGDYIDEVFVESDIMEVDDNLEHKLNQLIRKNKLEKIMVV